MNKLTTNNKDRLTTWAGIAALALIAMTGIGFLIARITGAIGFHYAPTGSMLPTLPVDSHFITSSLPYWRSQPQRGDLTTFIVPAQNNVLYIKRIIGLPGDKVQMRKGRLFLNNQQLPKKRLGDYRHKIKIFNELILRTYTQYEETLPSGSKYKVLEMSDQAPLDNTAVFKVPAGHFFMMGDNRDYSSDSRLSELVGFVPRKNIRGKYISRNPVTRLIFSMIKILEF